MTELEIRKVEQENYARKLAAWDTMGLIFLVFIFMPLMTWAIGFLQGGSVGIEMAKNICILQTK